MAIVKLEIKIDKKYVAELERKLKPVSESFKVIKDDFEFSFEGDIEDLAVKAPKSVPIPAPTPPPISQKTGVVYDSKERVHVEGFSRPVKRSKAEKIANVCALYDRDVPVTQICKLENLAPSTAWRYLLLTGRTTGKGCEGFGGNSPVGKPEPKITPVQTNLAARQMISLLSDPNNSISLEALQEHIATADFNDGLPNFSELGYRRKGGMQGAIYPLMALLCLPEKGRMTKAELQYFVGVTGATMEKYLIALSSDLDWVDVKVGTRNDGKKGAGYTKRVSYYKINPEVEGKLRARFGHEKHIAKIVSMLPLDMLSDAGQTFAYGSNNVEKMNKASYKLQERYLDAVANKLATGNKHYNKSVRSK